MTNHNIWLLALVIVAIGLGPALSGIAFAYTTDDDPHGPMQVYGWSVGLAAAGLMAGVGIVTIVRKR